MTRIEKNKIKKSAKTFLILAYSSGICFIIFLIAALSISNMYFWYGSILGIFIGLIFNVIAISNSRELSKYRAELYEKRDGYLLESAINLINENFGNNIKKIKQLHNLLHDPLYKGFLQGYYIAHARLSSDSKITKIAEEFFEKLNLKINSK